MQDSLVTTKLGAALKAKFGNDPKKLLQALGLDESLISDARRTESPMKPTRLAYAVLMNTAAAINPLLAFDKQVDYSPIIAGLTTKNFKARKPEIVKQLGAALKGKLAIDEGVTMGHVAKMLDHIEHEGMAAKPESLDESVSEPQHKAMEAAAHGQSNLGIPKDVGKEFAEADKGKTFDAGGVGNLKGFLKEKGMGDDDIAGACDALFKKVGGADEGGENKEQRKEDTAAVGDAEETPEEKAAREKKEGEDKARDEKMKGMVTKDELTTSIAAAVKAQRENDRATFQALDKVRPYVGELKGMTFDSAEQVFRHALKTMKVPKIDGVHASALETILDLQPKPGARPAQELANDSIATEAAAIDDYNKRFGGAHIVTVVGT
jgi:hypothetical protein